VSGDGPFAHVLRRVLNDRANPTCTVQTFSRGLLCRAADGETYIRAALSGDHRRRRARLEKRLSERGKLEYVEPGPDEPIERWIETFLQLEASGWKGREGTALACSETETQFFRTAAREAFRRQRLLMLALRLDDKTIAQRCSFLAGSGAFAF